MLDCLELELQQFDQWRICSTSLQVTLADSFPVDLSIQHHVRDHFHDPLPDGRLVNTDMRSDLENVRIFTLTI